MWLLWQQIKIENGGVSPVGEHIAWQSLVLIDTLQLSDNTTYILILIIHDSIFVSYKRTGMQKRVLEMLISMLSTVATNKQLRA